MCVLCEILLERGPACVTIIATADRFQAQRFFVKSSTRLTRPSLLAFVGVELKIPTADTSRGCHFCFLLLRYHLVSLLPIIFSHQVRKTGFLVRHVTVIGLGSPRCRMDVNCVVVWRWSNIHNALCCTSEMQLRSNCAATKDNLMVP